MVRRLLAASVTVLVLAAACGQTSSLVFGEFDGPCPSVRQGSGLDELTDGATCFVDEVNAGRPLVWDVVRFTVEGDLIPIRFEFDGAEVTIISDKRRDNFGSEGVTAERCGSVVLGGVLPEGQACERVDGDGFTDEGLGLE